jgi:hypothetical protein
MIRYKITSAALEKLIDLESPEWLGNATKKTARFKKLRRYKEKKGTWSLVKKVYMDLQHAKCAYCERQLEGGDPGKIEHDVEHFRPKSKVKLWPTPDIRKVLQLDYRFETGSASGKGYYLLPYNIFNYITSCKVCNSTFKSDYFPIAGSKRLTGVDDFNRLKTEKPLLLYPLGTIDSDPEKIITFQGMVPVPVAATGHGHNRARVIIDFFRLAVGREDLIRERALVIKSLYIAHLNENDRNRRKREDALLTIQMALSDRGPHTNCARAFYAVCLAASDTAADYYDAAISYLKSKGY